MTHAPIEKVRMLPHGKWRVSGTGQGASGPLIYTSAHSSATDSLQDASADSNAVVGLCSLSARKPGNQRRGSVRPETRHGGFRSGSSASSARRMYRVATAPEWARRLMAWSRITRHRKAQEASDSAAGRAV